MIVNDNESPERLTGINDGIISNQFSFNESKKSQELYNRNDVYNSD